MGRRTDTVWRSADGMDWEPAPDPPLDNLSCATVTGGVVVAGKVPVNGGDELGLVRTTDGRDWTPIGEPSTELVDVVEALAADGDRMVVATQREGDVRLFNSADGGASWRQHGAAAFQAMGFQSVWDIDVAGDRVLVVGRDDASGAVWLGPAP